MAKLVFRSGPYAGKSVSLPVGKAIVIGRNRDIDLPLPDLKLSRRHCQVMIQDDGQVVVKDLNSTNGTFLNGGRIIDEMPVNPFDRIVIGDTEIELQSTEKNDEFVPLNTSNDSTSTTKQNQEISSSPSVPTAAAVTSPSGTNSAQHGSTIQQVKSTPLELAIREMMLPLPPEPPPLEPAVVSGPAIIERPRLIFCDMCDASIPVADWQLGNAKEFEGKNYCKDCLAKGVIVGPPVPKPSPSVAGAKTKSMDDILAGLNEEAVMVDTTIKRRGVAVTDEKMAESITNFERATNQPAAKSMSERLKVVQPAAPVAVPVSSPAPVAAKSDPKPPPAPPPPADLGDEFEEIG